MLMFRKDESVLARRKHGLRTYVALVRKAEFKAVATELLVVNHALRDEANRLESTEENLTIAIANRDFAGFDLVDTAQVVRFGLLKKPGDAQAEPYITAMPDGGSPFHNLAIADVKPEFVKLVNRLEDCLPPEHPVRVDLVPLLRAQIATWEAALAAVLDAESQVDLAKGAVTRAVSAWDTAYARLYGKVFGEIRRRADRYFARSARPKAAKAPTPTVDAANPTPEVSPEASSDVDSDTVD